MLFSLTLLVQKVIQQKQFREKIFGDARNDCQMGRGLYCVSLQAPFT